MENIYSKFQLAVKAHPSMRELELELELYFWDRIKWAIGSSSHAMISTNRILCMKNYDYFYYF